VTQKIKLRKYKYELPKLTLTTIIIGVLLWMFYAFSFYFFLKLFKEFFRYFSASFHNNELLVVGDSSRNFFNFFFAFIAVLMAQSVVFTYWFNKPHKFKSNYSHRRISMINDHRLTNWYFIHWFTKMGVIIGLIAVDNYAFNLYSQYKYLFILAGIVLFAQTWTTFRLNFRNRGLKWILISFITVVSLSFALSRINLINYKELNELFLQNNTSYKYDIHVPESMNTTRANLFYSKVNVYLIAGNHPNFEIKIEGFSKVKFKNIHLAIAEYKKAFGYVEGRYALQFILNVDKNTKLKNVLAVKNVLLNTGVAIVSYAVKPINSVYKTPFYVNEGFITPSYSNQFNADLDNYIKIELSAKNKISVDGIPIETLQETVKNSQHNGTKYLFEIDFDETITFETYIKIINDLEIAINDMKSEFSTDYTRLVAEQYYSLNKENRKTLEQINQRISMTIYHKVIIPEAVKP